MTIFKHHVTDLFKLFLETSQNEYEEVREGISLTDEQFIETEFEILVDESTKKLWANGLSMSSAYFRKKAVLQQPPKVLFRENENFRTIALAWESKVSGAFNTDNALEQFCRGVVYEHQNVYGLLSPPDQSYLEKFADALLRGVENGSYPVHCLVFLKDLWVDRQQIIYEPFQLLQEAVPVIWVRKPVFEDYGKSRSLRSALVSDEIQNLQIRIGMQTAAIDFFWYEKNPIKSPFSPLSPSINFQLFMHSLESLFLLIDNASIRMTRFRYALGASGGPLSLFDSSPSRCIAVEKLEEKLKWVGKLMLPILMKKVKGDGVIERSFKYYQDSLFRSLGVESRIALSISGLEALYSISGEQKTEITLRISLRIARLLSHFGINPMEIKKDISKAYGIRSSHVHGGGAEKKDVHIVIELSERIDRYLRLSTLSLQHCINSNLPIEKVLVDLQEACFTLQVPKSISECLMEVKTTLFDSTLSIQY